jgi:ATP-binding cassette subfamily B protein
MPMRARSDLQIYQRLLVQARRYWPHIGGIFGLSLLSTPLALLNPLPLKLVVDSALGSEPLPGFLAPFAPVAIASSPYTVLVFAVALLATVTVLEYVRGFGAALLQTWTGERLVLDFRSELLSRVQRLSLGYHDRQGTTDSHYRIQ